MPPYPTEAADKKLATDWYTWGFQAGMEAERKTVARSSAGSGDASLADLELMQKQSGIPHLPTQFTYVMRQAMSGEGPRAYDWSDKPHRLVYDLCNEIERMAAQPQTVSKPVETATAVPTDALIKLANHWRNCDEDNDLVKVSRLALAEVLAYVQMVRPDLNGGQQGATKPVVLEPLPTDRYAVDDPWHRPPPINEPQGSSNPEGGK
jgi:hypothetical protein